MAWTQGAALAARPGALASLLVRLAGVSDGRIAAHDAARARELAALDSHAFGEAERLEAWSLCWRCRDALGDEVASLGPPPADPGVRAPERSAVGPGARARRGEVVRIEANGALVVVRFEPPLGEARAAAFERRFPSARWVEEIGAWALPHDTEHLAALARAAQGWRVVEGPLAPVLRALDWEKVGRSARSHALDADVVVPGFGKELLGYQRAGVRYMAEVRRAIIGDEQGLGKTVEALAALEFTGSYPAIVVCQASMKLAWAREAGECVAQRPVAVLAGTSAGPLPPDAAIVVINYELVAAWADELERLCARALVVDEAQAVKTRGAKRTKALSALASSVRRRDGAVWLLTGTPILNRPAELISPLTLLGRLDELGGWRGFTERYCGARRVVHNRRGDTHWDVSGASNLVELHERLRTTCYLRRSKREVMPELPAVVVGTAPLCDEDLDAQGLADYRRAEDELLSYVAERAGARGEDPDAARWRAMAAESLVQRTAMREALGRAKVPAAVRWVRQHLEEGEGKVVVFFWHKEPALECARQLSAPAIVGGMSPSEAEAAKERFQTDRSARAIVATIGAGGTGHTLTAAGSVVFVEEPWTPAMVAQAVARAYGRVNDAHGVVVWHLVAEHTVDEDVIALVARKAEALDALIEGRAGSDDADEEGVAAGVLRRLWRRRAGHPAQALEAPDDMENEMRRGAR